MKKETIRRKAKLSLIIWVGLYPTLLLVINLLEPYINTYPTAWQTFFVTIIVVPLMQFFVVPFVTKLLYYLGIDVE